jgi:hypothetical protein
VEHNDKDSQPSQRGWPKSLRGRRGRHMVVFLPGEQAGMRDFTDAVAGFPTFTHAARRTSQHVDFRATGTRRVLRH